MARQEIGSLVGALQATRVTDTLEHIKQDGTAGILEDKFRIFDKGIEEARLLYGDHLPPDVIKHLRAPLLEALGNQWRDVSRARTLAQERKLTLPQG